MFAIQQNKNQLPIGSSQPKKERNLFVKRPFSQLSQRFHRKTSDYSLTNSEWEVPQSLK